jgi:serine/threonine-protein kinase
VANKDDHRRCLSADKITAFIPGDLTLSERASAAQHLRECGDCFAIAARTLKRSIDERRSSAPPQSVHESVAATSIVASLPRGTTIDRYVILDRLGGGGMGVVYAAYDAELDRKLAIKLLRPDDPSSTSEAGRARLLREAQALARLRHDNVIGVYDVGAFAEQVFVAMELVDGVTLTQWLDEQRRSWRDVLDVFLQAGRALAAAHASGIVHRDFKPDNVMVGKDGRVRVLDFGLARAAHAPAPPTADASAPDALDGVGPQETLPARTHTAGIQGTPLYMSPEQWLMLPADARSDQFSFCVALYEALSRAQPFDGADLATLGQAVLSGQLQPLPAESDVPLWVRAPLLRGLTVTPDGRYPSMDDLLAALSSDPDVERRRQRRRALVATSFIALASVAAFGMVKAAKNGADRCRGMESRLAGVWDSGTKAAVRAAFAATGRPYASDTAARVERILDDYTTSWVKARTEACAATHVRGEQSAKLLDLKMACFDRRLQEIGALSALFKKAPDAEVLSKAVEASSHLTHLDACADTQALEAVVPPPDDPTVRATVTELRKRLAEVNGRWEAGKHRGLLEDAKRLAAATEKVPYAPLRAEVLFQLAMVEAAANHNQQAEIDYRSALVQALEGRDDVLAAQSWTRLVTEIGWGEGRYLDAVSLMPYADAAIRRIGNDPAARAFYCRVTGCVLVLHGEYDQAQELFENAVAILEKKGDSETLEFANTLENFADLSSLRGRYLDAERKHRRVLAIREKILGPRHMVLAQSHTYLCASLNDQHRFAEARQHCEHALEFDEWVSDNRGNAFTQRQLGIALAGLGRHDEGRLALEKCLAICERVLSKDHIEMTDPLMALGDEWMAEKRYSHARPQYERAARIYEKAAHPELSSALAGLARALLGLGRAKEARAAAERALAVFDANKASALASARTRFTLARALGSSDGDLARARALAIQARDSYSQAARAGAGVDNEVAEVEAWLQAAHDWRRLP